MRRVYIKLSRNELERLQELAEKHRRHPSAEAAELLAEAMQQHEKTQGTPEEEAVEQCK